MDSKHNRGVPHNSGAQKVVSAGIIVFRRTPDGIKFLVLYHGGDYWNFPKGKLEVAERSWQAAFREVKEETGLKQSELKLVTNFKEFEKFYFKRGDEKILKIVILYLAETKQARIVLSHEHEGYGWFTFAQAKKMLARHKDNLRILNQAYSFLTHPRPAQPPSNKNQGNQKPSQALKA